MDKRERILELVKEGVLSVEEGLDLLENLSEEESAAFKRKDFAEEDAKEEEEKTKEKSDHHSEDEKRAKAEEEKVKADKIEAIVNEINRYSVAVDQLNEKILATNNERSLIEEELKKIKGNQKEAFIKRKSELEQEIISLNKEINRMRSEEDLNEQADLALLEKELNEVLEELYLLENNKEANNEAKKLKEKRKELTEKAERLSQEKNEKMKEMHSLKMKQWTEKAKQLSDTMDLPEDWRQGASKTIDKAGQLLDEGTQSLTGFLRGTVKKTKDTLRDIDWDDVKVDLSKQAKASFSHQWLFEETKATILDFKNAAGDIQFKKSLNDTIKIEADIKLYEKEEGLSPLESFEEKVVIKIDEENFTFQIPTNKIKADLVIYLPERKYDYLRVHAMKGDLSFDAFTGNDLYIKVASGDLFFNQLNASMLEVNLSKGDLRLENTELKDLLVDTTHGDLKVMGDVQSSDLTTVSGDVLVTLTGEELIQLSARSVKGDVKVSLAEEMSFEIEARTTLGRVKSRLTVSDQSEEKQGENKINRFFRMSEGKLGQIKLQTSKGNILLKDQDKKEREKENKKEGKGESDEETNEV